MLLLPNVVSTAVPYVIVIIFIIEVDIVPQVVRGCEPFANRSEFMVVATRYESFLIVIWARASQAAFLLVANLTNHSLSDLFVKRLVKEVHWQPEQRWISRINRACRTLHSTVR